MKKEDSFPDADAYAAYERREPEPASWNPFAARPEATPLTQNPLESKTHAPRSPPQKQRKEADHWNPFAARPGVEEILELWAFLVHTPSRTSTGGREMDAGPISSKGGRSLTETPQAHPAAPPSPWNPFHASPEPTPEKELDPSLEDSYKKLANRDGAVKMRDNPLAAKHVPKQKKPRGAAAAREKASPARRRSSYGAVLETLGVGDAGPKHDGAAAAAAEAEAERFTSSRGAAPKSEPSTRAERRRTTQRRTRAARRLTKRPLGTRYKGGGEDPDKVKMVTNPHNKHDLAKKRTPPKPRPAPKPTPTSARRRSSYGQVLEKIGVHKPRPPVRDEDVPYGREAPGDVPMRDNPLAKHHKTTPKPRTASAAAESVPYGAEPNEDVPLRENPLSRQTPAVDFADVYSGTDESLAMTDNPAAGRHVRSPDVNLGDVYGHEEKVPLTDNPMAGDHRKTPAVGLENYDGPDEEVAFRSNPLFKGKRSTSAAAGDVYPRSDEGVPLRENPMSHQTPGAADVYPERDDAVPLTENPSKGEHVASPTVETGDAYAEKSQDVAMRENPMKGDRDATPAVGYENFQKSPEAVPMTDNPAADHHGAAHEPRDRATTLQSQSPEDDVEVDLGAVYEGRAGASAMANPLARRPKSTSAAAGDVYPEADDAVAGANPAAKSPAYRESKGEASGANPTKRPSPARETSAADLSMDYPSPSDKVAGENPVGRKPVTREASAADLSMDYPSPSDKVAGENPVGRKLVTREASAADLSMDYPSPSDKVAGENPMGQRTPKRTSTAADLSADSPATLLGACKTPDLKTDAPPWRTLTSVLEHSRVLLREGSAELETAVSRAKKRRVTRTRAESIKLQPVWKRLTAAVDAALRALADHAGGGEGRERVAELAESVSRDLGDYLDLEGDAADAGLARAGHYVPLVDHEDRGDDAHESFEVFGGETGRRMDGLGERKHARCACGPTTPVGVAGSGADLDHRAVGVARGCDDWELRGKLRSIFALYGLRGESASRRGSRVPGAPGDQQETSDAGHHAVVDELDLEALGEPLGDGAALALEAYAQSLEKALGAATSESPLLLDLALDARLAALRGRVARRRRRGPPRGPLPWTAGLAPAATGLGNALVKSARPRSALEAHGVALACKRADRQGYHQALRQALRPRNTSPAQVACRVELCYAGTNGLGLSSTPVEARHVPLSTPVEERGFSQAFMVHELERRARIADRALSPTLFNLGTTHRACGHYSAAADCYNAALRVANELGGREGTAVAGWALHERAATAEAVSALGRVFAYGTRRRRATTAEPSRPTARR